MPKNLGTLITSTIRPLSQNSGIATVLGNEIKGGYHVVGNLSDRNLITIDRRVFGMLVYVISSDEFYQLKTINSSSLSDNLNWSLVNIGGVLSSSEWLDSVNSRQSVPPGTPSVGERYLVVSGTGVWTGFDDIIVEWSGSAWQAFLPVEGVTIRVDDEVNSLYSYVGGDYNFGYWKKLNFSEFVVKYEVTSSEVIDIATYSQYLVYGDLQLDGQIENWGQLVIINGGVTGSGTVSGGGSLIQPEFLTEVYGATGLQISASGSYDRIVSLDIVSGTGISLNSIGNQLEISMVVGTNSEGYPQYVIGVGETIVVPDYKEYFIYGDLTVQGTLDIGTYGKVVVANGSFIAASGSVVNNMGNVEVYDLLTVADDNLKIDITEIKFGTAGRVLYESELKFVPLLGTFARVVTESNSLVYSTSSAYLTSTASPGFENYFGISVDDPLKKLHIRNSGILIDGDQPEQLLSLGDTNYSRFVVDTSTSNVESILQFRNDQGVVLHSSAEIVGGFRYPSLSIGTLSNNTLFNVSDYYGNDYFSVGVTGSVYVGTFSTNNSVNDFLVWDSSNNLVSVQSLKVSKSGFEVGASFSGSPLKITVTFSNPFSSTNYGVQVTGEDPRIWTIENKLTTGFDINSNSDTLFSGEVYWLSTEFGE